MATQAESVAFVSSNAERMLANMKDNIQILQRSAQAGTLKVPIEKAVADLGQALQQRLHLNNAILSDDSGLVPQALTMGVDPDDLDKLHGFLQGQVNKLVNTPPTTQAGLDALAADIIAASAPTKPVNVSDTLVA